MHPRLTSRWIRATFALLVVLMPLLADAREGLSQALSRSTPEEVGLSSERLGRLISTFEEYAEEGLLPGGVVLVARRGKMVFLEAFGKSDVESDTPMQIDAIFRIASQTKALVSVGVMMLHEEGRVLLTDPVGRYLPEFMETTVAVPAEGGGYEVIPATRPITIRDLLTHTAGIGYGGGLAADLWEAAGFTRWYFADRNEPIGASIARMAELPFEAQPGERWVYGYATDILGVLIERVSGQTLEAFLQSRILDPLGMTDTHFFLPPEKAERLAVVYMSGESGGLTRAPEEGGMFSQGAYVEGPRRSFSGGAGLLSTASDYARFLQMLLNAGELDGNRILSRKSVELMTVDHLGDVEFGNGQGFGLGFYVVEDLGHRGVLGSVGEFGWSGAYHTAYWIDPAEELVVAYFTQVIPAGKLDDVGKLRALVYQAIVD